MNDADALAAMEALEYPRFLSQILAKVDPMKIRMFASYREITPEQFLRNAYRADKTAEDVARDTNTFWTTMVH